MPSSPPIHVLHALAADAWHLPGRPLRIDRHDELAVALDEIARHAKSAAAYLRAHLRSRPKRRETLAEDLAQNAESLLDALGKLGVVAPFSGETTPEADRELALDQLTRTAETAFAAAYEANGDRAVPPFRAAVAAVLTATGYLGPAPTAPTTAPEETPV